MICVSAASQGNNAGLYIMLVLTVLLAPLWFVAIRSRRPERERWAGFRKLLDADSGTTKRGRTTGRLHGREIAFFSSPLGQNHHYFNIQVACSSPLRFDIWPRALIVIGTEKDSFDIGDADLDRSFHFTSGDAVCFKAWFERPENNRNVIALLYKGSRRCGLRQDGRLTWQIANDLSVDPISVPPQGVQRGRFIPAIPREKANEQERERVREVLQMLTQLAGRIEGC